MATKGTILVWSCIEGQDLLECSFDDVALDLERLVFLTDNKGIHTIQYRNQTLDCDVNYDDDDYNDCEWGDSISDRCTCYVSTGTQWRQLAWLDDGQPINLFAMNDHDKFMDAIDHETDLRELLNFSQFRC